MKAKKMVSRLKDIMNAERKEQLARYESLKKVLESLRDEEIRLKEDLENIKDSELRKELNSHLEVIAAQRRKGLQVLKAIKRAREKSAS